MIGQKDYWSEKDMDIRIITAPLVGGIIGLITNGLAIRMLFRPMKPVYIGKYRLPFTPGLIPKERSRIASSIGSVISNDLLNKDTLMETLLSESMKTQFSEKIDEIIVKYSLTEETVADVAEKIIDREKAQKKVDDARQALAAAITRKAIEHDIGKTITDYAYDEIIAKTKPILKPVASGALNSIKQPFAAKINAMIENKAKPVIEKFLADQSEEILNMPVKELAEKYRDRIPQLKTFLWNIYEEIIDKKLNDALNTVGIDEVVKNKINELELSELESMVMKLMKKELNALIWLGGLLGAVMGIINIFI